LIDKGFPKRERIVSQKIVDELFAASGHSLSAFPLRAVFKLLPASADSVSHVQILISAPKKRLHHAVERNRVKRQVREAWRHQKGLLLDRLPEDCMLAVAFIWQSDRLEPSALVESRMHHLLTRIAEKITPTPNS
jgi:ribonuclease P protein component